MIENRPISSARSVLRAATDAIHQRMHQHPGFAMLAAGVITRDDYRRLLARSYGFYSAAAIALGLPDRASSRILQDLQDLAMPDDAIARIPKCTTLSISTNLPARLGGTYVILGASLGGQIMARAISKSSASKAKLPTRFLAGDGDGDWSRFIAGLDAQLPDAQTRNAAAHAAVAMFSAFEAWMDGCTSR